MSKFYNCWRPLKIKQCPNFDRQPTGREIKSIKEILEKCRKCKYLKIIEISEKYGGRE